MNTSRLMLCSCCLTGCCCPAHACPARNIHPNLCAEHRAPAGLPPLETLVNLETNS